MSSPDGLVMGLGPGLFAIIVTFCVAFLIFLAASYIAPDASFFIFVGVMVLPVLVFAFIMSAPFDPSDAYLAKQASLDGTSGGLPTLPTTTVTPGTTTEVQVSASVFYKSDGPSFDSSPIADTYLPVRIVIIILGCLGVLLAAGYSLVIVLTAPPYTCPQVQCRRKLLEELHPTWYR